MFWSSSHGERRNAPLTDPRGPQRILSEFERLSISSECHGFLLRLRNLGIINTDQFERIIGRAIPVGPEKIELADVKALACSVIFDRDVDDVEDEAFDIFSDTALAD